ncbi:MAG: hypothetical protein SPE43_03875 [Ruminococcus sp.]|nr:hypothetical protein [Oscillospiraceae bacterium]MDY4413497.1 hypothetical protein [Ruminococcus sp.]
MNNLAEWINFEKTGKISDYLEYRRKAENEDNQRNSDKTEELRRKR